MELHNQRTPQPAPHQTHRLYERPHHPPRTPTTAPPSSPPATTWRIPCRHQPGIRIITRLSAVTFLQNHTNKPEGAIRADQKGLNNSFRSAGALHIARKSYPPARFDTTTPDTSPSAIRIHTPPEPQPRHGTPGDTDTSLSPAQNSAHVEGATASKRNRIAGRKTRPVRQLITMTPALAHHLRTGSSAFRTSPNFF